MKLSINNLSAWYGHAQALHDINIEVGDGEIVGVLGRNGAGKTTLLRSIAGLQPKISGEILVDNRPITSLSPDLIALHGLALLREGAAMAASLTVTQHLELGSRLARKRNRRGRTLDEIWRWFPLLQPLRHRPAGLLSGGQRQALALASAFIADPEILLLDEPSTGLAPVVAHELFAIIGKLARQGLRVLIVEQHPAFLEALAHRNYLLEVGSVIAHGDLREMLARQSFVNTA
jgi:branched-chain amino acid transport system ATP-binding protein